MQVRQAQGGSREALEELIRRHQAWIYNRSGRSATRLAVLAGRFASEPPLRMLYWPHDAEDTTQEILIKVSA